MLSLAVDETRSRPSPRRGLFVVGCARSGGTILQNALNASDEVFLFGEPLELYRDFRRAAMRGFDPIQLEQNSANPSPTHLTALGRLARPASWSAKACRARRSSSSGRRTYFQSGNNLVRCARFPSRRRGLSRVQNGAVAAPARGSEPMIDKRPFAALGGADHGWLKARHHFSFADYYDPQRMSWGSLRVWNDDEIAPQSGFPPHPHADMEIITYVRQGAISHRDSLGNEGRTEAGDVQVMSAGSGIRHAEYNLEPETTRIFQIGIVTITAKTGISNVRKRILLCPLASAASIL